MDHTDQELLRLLSIDARMSLKSLADEVGMSSPAIAERLQKLQENDVIRAFTLDLNAEAMGYPMVAIVRIRPLPGKLLVVERLLQEIPEVAECDRVTGDDCFVARVYLRSIQHLDEVLNRIIDKAQTSTSIVKSQVVKRRPAPFVTE
ncbi:Lrp/AsnC family transcriptional regulator [Terriglobus albidus]|uniref:Lrp/AsnC family transcriptional regulator n=1 Tax=Terriglobus albidus TaxID=1592106 RepID=A0A5B9EG87_9BACT|nr:Lrp/AsnC family transcriptional regulator [Terriglobus albidus]QEE31042.1 Lrp/AsnC family transcriptional regulator [Terriglobus albidus]